MIALPALIAVLLIAILTRVRGEERRARALLALVAELREEVRYDIPPARRAAIEGSILAVFRGAGRDAAEAGVAFFVSPTAALTVAHNLGVAGSARRHVGKVACVRPSDGARFAFDVVALDADLDCAVLRLRTGAPSAHFLTVSRGGIGVAAGDEGAFLVACNVRMAAEAPDAASVCAAWHRARVVRVHPHTFLYDAPSFNGDSDGAIIVARTGDVIGLHKELANAARELLKHKATVGERLSRVEASVQSLIKGSSSGCVGVRLDCDVARSLLSAAA